MCSKDLIGKQTKFCGSICNLSRWRRDNWEDYKKTKNYKISIKNSLLKLRREQPIKANARRNGHRKREDHCCKCFSREDLHFHHTNYEKNEGFTVCRSCHTRIHVYDNVNKRVVITQEVV